MAEYIKRMKELAVDLDEDNDRITSAPLPLLEPYPDRYATVALDCGNRLQFWDTEALYNWMLFSPTHPLTREVLPEPVQQYIKYYYTAMMQKLYRLEESNESDSESNNSESKDSDSKVINKYLTAKASHKPLDSVGHDQARAVIQPHHFADHFKIYEPSDTVLRFEREAANKELSASYSGSWLLRYSSFNRQQTPEHAEMARKLGLQFYALSWKTHEIEHAALIHRPGWGWTTMTNIDYFPDHVTINITRQWFPCFLDCLEDVLQKMKLCYNNRITGYIQR